ncbi:MAG: DUF5011 domain-containing protein, partial [Sulfurovum sp.]|nr:DUF5011 domain-containing protein [Sulfurovum sp.]
MMKKILKTTISLGAALVLSACGGGDNPPPVEGSSVGTLPPETGTAYYVDAPVSGVHFSCGSQTGVTDSNGALTFEVGSGCTLTIGDLVLRSVEGGELHDGVFIFEDNLPVAQMLQTLDNDGNASNGITITDEMLAYLENNVSLPSDPGDLNVSELFDEINGSVPGYEGHYVDETEAQAHIEETRQSLDHTPPVITLNGDVDMTIAHDSNFTDPWVSVSDDYYSENEINITVSGSVDINTIGDYTLTYTAVDGAGNSASVTRIVHVTDQTAPVISLEGDSFTIEVGTTLTQADAISRVGATATDVVDGSVTVSANISQVETTVVGDYNIVLAAVDNAGNESTVTVIVHVTDTTAPVITLNGDNPDTVEVAQGSSYSDPGASVTDNSGETITPVVTGEVNTTQIGTYTLTYTATDSSGNESNVSRTVSVVDTTPPVVTPNGDNPMTVLVNENYVDAGASVTDNSGESLTATVVQSNTVDTTTTGTYEVVYVARDSSGNEGTATRTVTVINGQPPVITLLGDNPVYVEINTPFNDPGATANDFEDGDISAYISSNAATAVDVNTTGSYVVTYTVTDSSGNTVTAERNVTVEDTIAPVIVLNGDNPMTVSQDATFIDPGATVTDNSGETIDVNVTGSVDTAAVGTYTLTYYAQDSAGNAATPVTRTVNVVDVTPPVITVDPLEVTVEIGTVLTIDDALSGVSAVDAVDGSVSVDANVSGVDLNATGDYTIFYTAVDSAGNEAQATRTLHIVDTTPPVITLNGDNPMNLLVGD